VLRTGPQDPRAARRAVNAHIRHAQHRVLLAVRVEAAHIAHQAAVVATESVVAATAAAVAAVEVAHEVVVVVSGLSERPKPKSQNS